MNQARPDVEAYLAAVESGGSASIIDLDPVVAREMGRQAAPLVELPPREMRRQDVAIPSRGHHTIPARLYFPVEASGSAPVIVFYHGGGWVLGDIDGYDSLCSEIAYQTGMTLISVDYRLAPEHIFPAAFEDSLDATRWAGTSPSLLGHPVSGLVLAGDSAGGSLAAAVTRELLDDLPIPIRVQWLIYPVTDLSVVYPSDKELSPVFGLTDEAMDKFYRHYFGNDEMAAKKCHPHVSPLLGERWRGLPPAPVFTCSLDPLRDQGRAYAAKLASHGVEMVFHEAEGQIHGCFTMRKLLPSAQADLMKGVKAIKFLMGGT